ncbi:3'-5' exonuclease [Necropsobacter massiliensis]|uniref:3'-5' exonuclease n=1 Tax=Necropsobacter massiliensis TaxID=1400001 RepID=UPI000596109A|nr:3'-5' exonuclease [Necropsobacter massiliensis]
MNFKVINRLRQRFHPLSRLEQQRRAFYARLANTDYPEQWREWFQQPYPKTETNLTALSYLVIDFETTGLNSMLDNILSVAAVPIDNLKLDLSRSWHQFVARQQVKGDTAVVNHIVPQMLNGVENLDDVMNELFYRMQGRIIIAHGSTIEKRFMYHYLASRYGLRSFPLLWLDTLKIERSLLNDSTQTDYRLSTIRQAYNLPEYICHNALIDAIAAGELFLAQLERLFGKQRKLLGEVYKRSL